VPLSHPPPEAPEEKPAWDVEAGPQVAEAAEAMQLTGHIDLVGKRSMEGTSPVQLKPMDREQVARMRDMKPPSVPPVMQPGVRAGKIDEETLKHAAEEAASTRQRTGDVLILMGALTEEERLYYVGQQIKSILYSVSAWEEGAFSLSFQARARKEAIKLDIHPANLIMRGIRKLYKPERLKRLMPQSARPTPSQEPSFNLSDVELQAWEAHLLPRCDGNR